MAWSAQEDLSEEGTRAEPPSLAGIGQVIKGGSKHRYSGGVMLFDQKGCAQLPCGPALLSWDFISLRDVAAAHYKIPVSEALVGPALGLFHLPLYRLLPFPPCSLPWEAVLYGPHQPTSLPTVLVF